MPDYSKSIIYKIYDNTNGDTYYGSTCSELRYRMNNHKTNASPNHKGTPPVSKQIILNGNYDASVVERFPCETKQQLHTRERWWIENNKCINKQIPIRDKGENNHIYYKLNNEKLREKQSEYYKNHKEHCAIRDAEKVLCECGSMVRRSYYFKRHKRTASHIEKMALIDDKTPTCIPRQKQTTIPCLPV